MGARGEVLRARSLSGVLIEREHTHRGMQGEGMPCTTFGETHTYGKMQRFTVSPPNLTF